MLQKMVIDIAEKGGGGSGVFQDMDLGEIQELINTRVITRVIKGRQGDRDDCLRTVPDDEEEDVEAVPESKWT